MLHVVHRVADDASMLLLLLICRVQVQALPGVAYFGSSGGTYTDYFVTERLVSPPDVAAAQHTEKLLYFPHTYAVCFRRQICSVFHSLNPVA
jgi:predicted O-linked N-acetylglucosamine transferase (SPINDLY family)